MPFQHSQHSKDLEIEELEVDSSSRQMSLFEIIEPLARRGEYSNTIELYDALPKYVWEKTREFDDLSMAVITRRSKIRGTEYIIKLKPAIIEKEGRTVLIYPSQREELVEDALRKIAVNGGGYLIEGKAGVMFSLYELRGELASTGHTFSEAEIKEAIMVCRGATLECQSLNGDSLISSSFFPMIGLTSREKYVNVKGDTRCYVQFNPMVTDSILGLTFRQYSYKKAMKLSSPLARYIYKRMSHYWSQAAQDAPYTPSLVSFLEQSPRGLSVRMPENIRAMKNALDVLVNENVLSDYDAERIKDGRATADVRYTIRPTADFVSQVKAANHRAKQVKLMDMKQRVKVGKNADL